MLYAAKHLRRGGLKCRRAFEGGALRFPFEFRYYQLNSDTFVVVLFEMTKQSLRAKCYQPFIETFAPVGIVWGAAFSVSIAKPAADL